VIIYKVGYAPKEGKKRLNTCRIYNSVAVARPGGYERAT